MTLDTGRLQRFEPDPIPRPPAARSSDDADPAGAIERPRYEGWISTGDLARDAAGVVAQVAASGIPLLVMHRKQAPVMLANYDIYQGQLATLDETSFSDWQDRLARARRELADGELVPQEEAPAEWPFRRPSDGPPPAARFSSAWRASYVSRTFAPTRSTSGALSLRTKAGRKASTGHSGFKARKVT